MNPKLINAALFLTIVLASFSCKKTDDNSYFYVRGTFGGSAVDWTSPRNTSGSSASKFWVAFVEPGASMPLSYPCSAGDSDYQYRMGTYIFESLEPGVGSRNNIAVNFVRSGTYSFNNVTAEMKSLFTNGPKTFGLHRYSCTDPIVDGIVITYTDNSGVVWRSDNQNPQDHFEQIALTDKHGIGTYEKDWKVKFNCKLYDASGNFINVENAEVFGPVFIQ